MASKTKIINLTRMSRVFQPVATSGSFDSGEKTEITSKSHKVCVF